MYATFFFTVWGHSPPAVPLGTHNLSSLLLTLGMRRKHISGCIWRHVITVKGYLCLLLNSNQTFQTGVATSYYDPLRAGKGIIRICRSNKQISYRLI